MKIKVTYEQVFDSDEFYAGWPEEDLKLIDFETFRIGIIQDTCEDPQYTTDCFKFEELSEC